MSVILTCISILLFLTRTCDGSSVRDSVSTSYPECSIREVTEQEHNAGSISTQNYPWPYPSDMNKCYVLFSPYDKTVGLWLSDIDMKCSDADVKISRISSDSMTRTTLEDGVCSMDGRTEDYGRFLQNELIHVQFNAIVDTNYVIRGA